MSQMLVAPSRRISPIAGFVVAVALFAVLMLGFGLRVWTEHTPAAQAPIVVHDFGAPTPDPICRIGRPC